MARWRVNGDIGFRTVNVRSNFVQAANAWKATRPLLRDNSSLVNVGDEGEEGLLFPTVRIDVAFMADLHGLDFWDWIRAQPTAGVERIFLSAHHCRLDGTQDPQVVRYFSWVRP